MDKINYWKLAGAAALLFYALYYSSDLTDWHFIDSVNLVVHEAGHVVFVLFGEFMQILGGSLLQVLLPAVFAFYFFWQKQYFSASVVLTWVGINFVNVSVYAGDALAMKLPLLTGDVDTHDWNQLLFQLNLLSQTELISWIIFIMGILVFVLAFGVGVYSSLKTDIDSKSV